MNKSKVIIGIDPGQKGSMSVLVVKGREASLERLIRYNIEEYIMTLKFYSTMDRTIILESVHSMPRDSHKSAFKFGKSFGELTGMLVSLGQPFILTTPQHWQNILINQYKIDKGDNTKEAIGRFIYEILDDNYKEIILKPRAKTIDTDLTDSIAISLSRYVEEFLLEQPTISEEATRSKGIAKQRRKSFNKK